MVGLKDGTGVGAAVGAGKQADEAGREYGVAAGQAAHTEAPVAAEKVFAAQEMGTVAPAAAV